MKFHTQDVLLILLFIRYLTVALTGRMTLEHRIRPEWCPSGETLREKITSPVTSSSQSHDLRLALLWLLFNCQHKPQCSPRNSSLIRISRGIHVLPWCHKGLWHGSHVWDHTLNQASAPPPHTSWFLFLSDHVEGPAKLGKVLLCCRRLETQG